jgi:hypothetical protein
LNRLLEKRIVRASRRARSFSMLLEMFCLLVVLSFARLSLSNRLETSPTELSMLLLWIVPVV